MGFSLDELREEIESGRRKREGMRRAPSARKRFRLEKGGLAMRSLTMLGAALILFAGVSTFLPEAPAQTQTVSGSGSERQIPIYRVETDEKKVAISFDAAWGADKTSGIMDILEEYDVQATFYLVGFWVDKYPEKVQEINERGFELGNHSSTHPKMTTLTAEQMLLEVNTCTDKIEKLTGVRTRLFRPPYGDYNDEMVRVLRGAGYEVTQWNTDSLDWKNLGVQSMVSQVTKNVQPGDLVLFHNNSDHILEALPLILTWFQNNGYQVMNVGDLLLEGDFYVDHTGMMRAVVQ
ncbi:MAG: polysaccharide deacetylase family protein [Christensenellales bacterium]|jgi:polysaccharide deacetylase family sporulation protein PdaB